MATDPFPVNRLPYLARRNVLAVMNMPEFFFQFDGFLRGRTSTPYFEYLDDNPENQPLRHPTFGAREWVQHLMEVLNIGKITAIMFNTGAEDFDPEDLSKVFGNYQLLELLFGNEDYSDEYLRKINELFTPIQSLFLNKKLSNEEDFHRKATNSNVELTNIWYPIDLAGLSVINCPSMAIAKTNMTPTDFNSFIKRWINQTAATKLKQMHIRFPERRFGEDYLPKVFEGVDNQYFEEERTYPILLHTLHNLGQEHVFKDGYTIERNDGVKAKSLNRLASGNQAFHLTSLHTTKLEQNPFSSCTSFVFEETSQPANLVNLF